MWCYTRLSHRPVCPWCAFDQSSCQPSSFRFQFYFINPFSERGISHFAAVEIHFKIHFIEIIFYLWEWGYEFRTTDTTTLEKIAPEAFVNVLVYMLPFLPACFVISSSRFCPYVCLYVCIFVCWYVYMYVCVYVCMYVCMYVFSYVRLSICMNVCLYVCLHLRMCLEVSSQPLTTQMCMSMHAHAYYETPHTYIHASLSHLHISTISSIYICIHIWYIHIDTRLVSPSLLPSYPPPLCSWPVCNSMRVRDMCLGVKVCVSVRQRHLVFS